jgi:hypothetical protein
MAHINISFQSEEFSTESGQHLANFLGSLKELPRQYYGEPVCSGELKGKVAVLEAPSQDTAEDKPKTTRNRSKKAETVTEEVATPEEQAVANEVETVAEEVAPEEEDDLMGDEAAETAAPTVTREMVRSKVSDKQAAHKDAIRAKLKDLGAENVTKLEDKHFGDFYAFLNKLA